jgi:hypothetical protein
MKNLMKTGLVMLVIAIILIAISTVFMRAHAASEIVTENRDINLKVTSIVMNGSIDLNLKQAGNASLLLRGSANNLSHIITRIEGNTLYVDTRGFIISVNQPLVAEISLPNLEKLQIHGSGDASVKGFKGKRLDAQLHGAGDLRFESDYQQLIATVNGSGDAQLSTEHGDYIEVNLSGSGDVTLKGQANLLSAKISGSGNLNSTALKVNQATLNASGSGDLKVFVANDIQLRLSGSGDATILGNPPKRSIEQVGSGRVR